MKTLNSPGSDGEDTTMTPTLDRVAVSNLTKALSVPNLPVSKPIFNLSPFYESHLPLCCFTA